MLTLLLFLPQCNINPLQLLHELIEPIFILVTFHIHILKLNDSSPILLLFMLIVSNNVFVVSYFRVELEFVFAEDVYFGLFRKAL